jgi:hypothetical protein
MYYLKYLDIKSKKEQARSDLSALSRFEAENEDIKER